MIFFYSIIILLKFTKCQDNEANYFLITNIHFEDDNCILLYVFILFSDFFKSDTEKNSNKYDFSTELYRFLEHCTDENLIKSFTEILKKNEKHFKSYDKNFLKQKKCEIHEEKSLFNLCDVISKIDCCFEQIDETKNNINKSLVDICKLIINTFLSSLIHLSNRCCVICFLINFFTINTINFFQFEKFYIENNLKEYYFENIYVVLINKQDYIEHFFQVKSNWAVVKIEKNSMIKISKEKRNIYFKYIFPFSCLNDNLVSCDFETLTNQFDHILKLSNTNLVYYNVNNYSFAFNKVFEYQKYIEKNKMVDFLFDKGIVLDQTENESIFCFFNCLYKNYTFFDNNFPLLDFQKTYSQNSENFPSKVLFIYLKNSLLKFDNDCIQSYAINMIIYLTKKKKNDLLEHILKMYLDYNNKFVDFSEIDTKIKFLILSIFIYLHQFNKQSEIKNLKDSKLLNEYYTHQIIMIKSDNRHEIIKKFFQYIGVNQFENKDKILDKLKTFELDDILFFIIKLYVKTYLYKSFNSYEMFFMLTMYHEINDQENVDYYSINVENETSLTNLIYIINVNKNQTKRIEIVFDSFFLFSYFFADFNAINQMDLYNKISKEHWIVYQNTKYIHDYIFIMFEPDYISILNYTFDFCCLANFNNNIIQKIYENLINRENLLFLEIRKISLQQPSESN
ncbi:hypothetical protein GVAV_001172 [Gurleya vavrai]